MPRVCDLPQYAVVRTKVGCSSLSERHGHAPRGCGETQGNADPARLLPEAQRWRREPIGALSFIGGLSHLLHLSCQQEPS